MGLPAVEARVIMYRFAEEFRDTPAPYYGVNIIDVNEENWDPFIEQIRTTHAGVSLQRPASRGQVLDLLDVPTA